MVALPLRDGPGDLVDGLWIRMETLANVPEQPTQIFKV